MRKFFVFSLLSFLMASLLFAHGAFARGESQQEEDRKAFTKGLEERRGSVEGSFRRFFGFDRTERVLEHFQATVRRGPFPDMRKRLWDIREQFLEEAGERRERMSREWGERRAERIDGFFDRLVEKGGSTMERLGRFADRIRERLDSLAARGVSVDDLKEELRRADDSIEKAEDALSSAVARYGSAVASQDFKGAFSAVEDKVGEFKEELRKAHGILRSIARHLEERAGSALLRTATSTNPLLPSRE